MKVTHSCLPVRQDPRKKEKDFPRSTSEPWAAASSRDFKSPLRENPPSVLSLERVLWQRLTLMPPSALAGPLSLPQDSWLGSVQGQRATSSKKQRVQGGGFTKRGDSLPARPRPLPRFQPGQLPSHATLSFSASDAPRGAPRFFHQKSQKQNEKQIRPRAASQVLYLPLW